MKRFQIEAKKGFFKSITGNFPLDLYKRVDYTVSVVPPTMYTIITFKPAEGLEEISIEDFKAICNLLN
jgi:hypothetical protein